MGDYPLFWAEAGAERSGPPVLFLHGIPTWSWLWRNVIPETGLEHRCIALDLPGFGLSDKSPRHSFRLPALAETVESFMDAVSGPGQEVNLVVHDFGALVGAELIARDPKRYPCLVITNTSLRPEAWAGEGILRLLGIPYLGDFAMMVARPWMLHFAMRPFVADPRARTSERVAGYWYPFTAGFGSSLARLYRERPLERGDFERWRRALQEYSGNSLIAWGERDPAFTLTEVEDIQGLLSEARYQGFENASHFLPEERPLALGRRIRTFISGRTR